MKKTRILNKALISAIADMGHGDIMVISDAGFPIPRQEQRIDLAIEADKPGIVEILDLIMSEFIHERIVVAEEQKLYNPEHFKRVSEVSDRCPVETIPHAQFIVEFPVKAKYIVRTGGLEPWGNVVLQSGIDAPEWFKKPGCKVPDYYEERVSYKEDKQ